MAMASLVYIKLDGSAGKRKSKEEAKDLVMVERLGHES